jgi:hypothetical protein
LANAAFSRGLASVKRYVKLLNKGRATKSAGQGMMQQARQGYVWTILERRSSHREGGRNSMMSHQAFSVII